jgi:hypothetical protein
MAINKKSMAVVVVPAPTTETTKSAVARIASALLPTASALLLIFIGALPPVLPQNSSTLFCSLTSPTAWKAKLCNRRRI